MVIIVVCMLLLLFLRPPTNLLGPGRYLVCRRQIQHRRILRKPYLYLYYFAIWLCKKATRGRFFVYPFCCSSAPICTHLHPSADTY